MLKKSSVIEYFSLNSAIFKKAYPIENRILVRNENRQW